MADFYQTGIVTTLPQVGVPIHSSALHDTDTEYSRSNRTIASEDK
jgi:hypothetical protein